MYLSSKFEKKSLAYAGTTQKHHDYILFSVTAKKQLLMAAPFVVYHSSSATLLICKCMISRLYLFVLFGLREDPNQGETSLVLLSPSPLSLPSFTSPPSLVVRSLIP